MTTGPLAGVHKQDTLCVTQTPLVFMCFLYAMVVVLTQKKIWSNLNDRNKLRV